MGKDQQSAAGSKTEKNPQFRFSRAGTAFLKDYFHYTNNAPKKKEREHILAHLKELGDTQVTDARISNWFIYGRQKEKRRPSIPLPTSALEQNENKWLDARHKTLWPSVAKKSIGDLEELYNQHIVQEGTEAEPPYDLWAEGLDAKPEHVRLWCKFKARQSARQPQPNAVPMAETSSRMTEGHSQLPTPGNSTSPEPPAFGSWPPHPPDPVKDEPPVSPVVERTRFPPQHEGPKEKSSMGLHEAIESAFSAPPHPPALSIQQKPPPLTALVDQEREPSSRSISQTLVVPRAISPSILAGDTADLTSAPLPPASIASPPSKPEPSSPPLHSEPSVPPSSEESIQGPSTQPDRDIARERANLVTGVAAKLDELNVIFNSTHGLSQLAGSIQGISKRNQQFLDDVAGGRFEKFHLTSAHLPPQAAGPMPEFNPLQVLAGRQDSKGKGKEREDEDEMKVD